MISKIKQGLKRILPVRVISGYHYVVAMVGALVYGFPSQKLFVIGVTGTKGKTTTSEFIAKVLESAGYKVGLISTVSIKIGSYHEMNTLKMTMPGRFKLQKYLQKMVRNGCQYAVIETSSEGIKQWRHLGINYDIAVFTSLSPEHLSSHGTFENYKRAKGELFRRLAKKRKILRGEPVRKMILVNGDDPHAEYFLQFPADIKERYSFSEAQNIFSTDEHTLFTFQGTSFDLKILGTLNIMNALAAIHIGLSQGVSLGQSAFALRELSGIPGRMEVIQKEPFMVIVDYAHEPRSIQELYESVKKFHHGKIITLIGAEGGGRDTTKRPIMGRLSAEACDFVIITNVDPYSDAPGPIIEDIKRGAVEGGKQEGKNLFCIEDRRDAIRKAFALAKTGDLVLLTGKGAEQAMVIGGTCFPWDDRRIARELLSVENRA